MSETDDNELVVKQDSPVVQAIMNRPEALNSLSLEMIRLFSAGLDVWDGNDKVKAIFIKGAGDRAFCAGGDVKSTYRTGMSYRRGQVDERIISLFFGEEYRLNRQLFHFEKPIFAFMNGITMGGGFGIAGPCQYRIASENTVFAMPEVAIGFFPDVGSTYFLNKCPGQAGTYLAVTGNSINPSDMLFCGLATHYVPLDKHSELEEQLKIAFDDDGDIDEILESFHVDPKENGALERNIEMINKHFAGESIEAIRDSLRADGGAWAKGCADTIEGRSPTSLKVSLAHLRMAANKDFDEITAQDFVLAQHFMRGHDFYEGVRAVLVDKDKQPQWEPDSLAGVTVERVLDYFRPAGLVLDEIAA